MNYNEQERQRRAADEANRKRFNDSLTTGHNEMVKTLAERTVANAEAAMAEQARVKAAADQAVHEAALRASLRESYIRANGSEFGFAEQFPKLRAAYVQAQTLANVSPKPTTTAAVAKRTLDLLYSKES